MKDMLIIGNGPAGISASLYASRAGLSVTVIGKDNGALAKAEKIENYFGLDRVLSGPELIETGLRQATTLGVEIISDEIFDISYADSFVVSGKLGNYSAKVVLLATGAARKTIKIEGLEKFEGSGVSYCAVCDAFFYRGKDVAVLGNGEYALHEIKELLPIAKSVTLLTNGVKTKTDFPKEVSIITEPIKKLFGNMMIEGAEFKDGSKVSFNGLFVALGSAAAGDLARKIGAEVSGDKIVVDDNMATNIPGLLAAGDCIGGILQVSTAVAEGAKAAMTGIAYLRKASTTYK